MDDDADRILRAFFTSVEEGLSLLEAEPQLLTARTGFGETPLHYLAVENQQEAIRVLVEKKRADVNTLNHFGHTPLSEAASLGHLDLIRYLLSVGAQLHIPGKKIACYMRQYAQAHLK